MQEIEISIQEEFTLNNRVFKYDFNTINIEQAEMAREVVEFKYNQSQNQPESFRQVIKSGGAEWLTKAMSYLVREYKNNSLIPFNRDKAETDVEIFIKSLPITDRKRMVACVDDFFSAIGMKSIISALLSNERKKSGIEMLLPLIPRLMNSKSGKDNLSDIS